MSLMHEDPGLYELLKWLQILRVEYPAFSGDIDQAIDNISICINLGCTGTRREFSNIKETIRYFQDLIDNEQSKYL